MALTYFWSAEVFRSKNVGRYLQSSDKKCSFLQVQTELHFNTAQMPKDVDSKLVGSLKHLSAVMEAELAKGVTQVFTFRPE